MLVATYMQQYKVFKSTLGVKVYIRSDINGITRNSLRLRFKTGNTCTMCAQRPEKFVLSGFAPNITHRFLSNFISLSNQRQDYLKVN